MLFVDIVLQQFTCLYIVQSVFSNPLTHCSYMLSVLLCGFAVTGHFFRSLCAEHASQ